MVDMNSSKYRPAATATMRNLLSQQLDENKELQKSLKSFKTDSKNRRLGSQMYNRLPFSVAQSQVQIDNDGGEIIGKVGTIKV